MPTSNIPASMISKYSDEMVIIRSEDPSELVQAVERVDRSRIEYIQLIGAHPEVAPFSHLDPTVPLEIALKHAEKEAEYLPLYSNAAFRNPIRVLINTSRGFMSAVTTATSLRIETRLIVHQPDEALVQELESALDLYLYNAEVEVPIEFFHSLLKALCRNHLDDSLWLIQHEDPARDRYVLDSGIIVISPRLPIEIYVRSGDFLDDYRFDLMAQQGECSICPYFTQCVGYFKFPDEAYSCKGVRKIFSKLKGAANEIKAFQAERPQKPHEHCCADEECGCS
jgi:hypothetical protein